MRFVSVTIALSLKTFQVILRWWETALGTRLPEPDTHVSSRSLLILQNCNIHYQFVYTIRDHILYIFAIFKIFKVYAFSTFILQDGP